MALSSCPCQLLHQEFTCSAQAVISVADGTLVQPAIQKDTLPCSKPLTVLCHCGLGPSEIELKLANQPTCSQYASMQIQLAVRRRWSRLGLPFQQRLSLTWRVALNWRSFDKSEDASAVRMQMLQRNASDTACDQPEQAPQASLVGGL